ncbi:MAG: hypothetical protein M2R45_00652 [Verrucomicrobia subdivision 3 bacterium]|nr:hypothetical protein [Limisphaerales bacterium]MCS1414465.1 hypothetical protein [Limisphaerales bacterium]
MNTPIKIVFYFILSVTAVYFGKHFFRDYSAVNAAKAELSDDPMDVFVPTYNVDGSLETRTEDNETDVVITATTEEQDMARAPLNTDTGGTASNADTSAEPTKAPVSNPATKTETADTPEPRVGFYGGGFCIIMICLGLLAARDISQFIGNRAVGVLFNDDGVQDDEYEAAEAEWGKGDYLEAIRLMREYLAKHPRQQHAALRIAEIYEKDLNNPLAAALEYKEILQKKLPRERWGWAAIHLANLYSGPLEKPDQAITLLRRLDSEYGDTQAAEKARRRLAMIDRATLPEESEEG